MRRDDVGLGWGLVTVGGSSEGDMKTASSRKYEGYEVSTGCISLALSPPSSPFILSSHSSHFHTPRRGLRRGAEEG